MTKKVEYARGGVPEYYILHRDEALQGFFTRDARGVYVPMDIADGVVRSLVLPGFRFRVADLARQPALAAMRDDVLYQDFVLPEWQQAERQAREEAQARTEAEKQARIEVQARKEAEMKAREETQARQAAEMQAREEVQARTEAEMKTREEVQARQAAEQRSGREAEARLAAEQEVERLRALLKQRDLK